MVYRLFVNKKREKEMAIPAIALAAGKAIASGAVGRMFGMMAEKGQDNRQLEQNRKLQEQQMEGAKEMALFKQGLEKKMLDDTNYEYQKTKMKEAGLNPALMYGMGGGGGATIGSGGMAMPSGATAGDPNAGTSNAMGMAMMMSNMKLMESQTNKNNAEAAKIGGVDTEKTTTEIASIKQGITNSQAIEKLTKVETQLKEIAQVREYETLEASVSRIKYETQKAESEAESAFAEAKVDTGTIAQRMSIIKNEAVAGVVRNALTRAQTEQTNSNIQVNEAEIKKIAAEITQKWVGLNQGQQGLDQRGQDLSQQGDRVKIEKFKAEIEAQYKSIFNVAGGRIDTAIDAITDLLTGKVNGEYKDNKKVK